MAVIDIRRTVSLDGPIVPEAITGTLYGGEALAHRFTISATSQGVVSPLSGTVTATFLRLADGAEVPLTGSVSGGAARVTLAQSCYTRPGRFELTIFITSGSSTTAIYSVSGNIRNTSAGTIVDPGQVVPSVEDIIAEYGQMQAAVDAANAAAATAGAAVSYIAPTFSDQTAYTAGQYVIQGDRLYRFTADHAAGAWTGSDAVAVNVGGQLTNANTEIGRVAGYIAGVFDPATAYAAGDYVIRGGALWRFTEDHAAGAWIGTDAEQVTVGGELQTTAAARGRISARIDTISGPIYYDPQTANALTRAEIKSDTGAAVSSYNARMTGFIRVVRGDFIHYGGVAPQGYLSVAMYSAADESTFTGEWYRWYAASSTAADQHIIPIYKTGYIRVSWLAYDSATATDYSQYMSFALYRTAVSRALTGAHRDWFVSAIPQGSRISVIGDSISTYRGYSDSADNSPRYPTGDFLLPSYTWWMRVINAAGGVLDTNSSYSGSRASARDGAPSFYDRAHAGSAGTADVIFVELGTADSTSNVPLGDYDFTTATIASLSEATFRTAYIKGLRALQYNYPAARIVCLIAEMGDGYADSIKVIAEHYGVRWVDVRGYAALAEGDVHPSVYGMAQIATEAMWQPDASLALERIPAEAAAVGDALAARDTRMDGITGDEYYGPAEIAALDKLYIRINSDSKLPETVAANYGRTTGFIRVNAGDLLVYRGIAQQGYISLATYTAASDGSGTGMFYRWWPADSEPGSTHVVPVLRDGYIRASWTIGSTTADYSQLVGLTVCRGAMAGAYNLSRAAWQVSRYAGGVVSVIGDSISSYKGISNLSTGDPAAFYPSNGLLDPLDTWWMRVINAGGAALGENLSYAGSFATKQTAYSERPSFYDRAHAGMLADPDVIFVALGTNDSLNSVPLGSYDFTTATIANLSETTFRTAYIKGVRALMYNYPDAEIVCVAMEMGDEYAESIEVIAHHYGQRFVDARGYAGIAEGNVHPSAAGMRTISSAVLAKPDDTLTEAGTAADAAAVGAALRALEARVAALET